jgi:hypothetical protein
MPSMRRPVRVKAVFFFLLPAGQCCYLIIDLDSHLFDGSWARH